MVSEPSGCCIVLLVLPLVLMSLLFLRRYILAERQGSLTGIYRRVRWPLLDCALGGS